MDRAFSDEDAPMEEQQSPRVASEIAREAPRGESSTWPGEYDRRDELLGMRDSRRRRSKRRRSSKRKKQRILEQEDSSGEESCESGSLFGEQNDEFDAEGDSDMSSEGFAMEDRRELDVIDADTLQDTSSTAASPVDSEICKVTHISAKEGMTTCFLSTAHWAKIADANATSSSHDKEYSDASETVRKLVSQRQETDVTHLWRVTMPIWMIGDKLGKGQLGGLSQNELAFVNACLTIMGMLQRLKEKTQYMGTTQEDCLQNDAESQQPPESEGATQKKKRGRPPKNAKGAGRPLKKPVESNYMDNSKFAWKDEHGVVHMIDKHTTMVQVHRATKESTTASTFLPSIKKFPKSIYSHDGTVIPDADEAFYRACFELESDSDGLRSFVEESEAVAISVLVLICDPKFSTAHALNKIFEENTEYRNRLKNDRSVIGFGPPSSATDAEKASWTICNMGEWVQVVDSYKLSDQPRHLVVTEHATHDVEYYERLANPVYQSQQPRAVDNLSVAELATDAATFLKVRGHQNKHPYDPDMALNPLYAGSRLTFYEKGVQCMRLISEDRLLPIDNEPVPHYFMRRGRPTVYSADKNSTKFVARFGLPHQAGLLSFAVLNNVYLNLCNMPLPDKAQNFMRPVYSLRIFQDVRSKNDQGLLDLSVKSPKALNAMKQFMSGYEMRHDSIIASPEGEAAKYEQQQSKVPDVLDSNAGSGIAKDRNAMKQGQRWAQLIENYKSLARTVQAKFKLGLEMIHYKDNTRPTFDAKYVPPVIVTEHAMWSVFVWYAFNHPHQLADHFGLEMTACLLSSGTNSLDYLTTLEALKERCDDPEQDYNPLKSAVCNAFPYNMLKLCIGENEYECYVDNQTRTMLKKKWPHANVFGESLTCNPMISTVFRLAAHGRYESIKQNNEISDSSGSATSHGQHYPKAILGLPSGEDAAIEKQRMNKILDMLSKSDSDKDAIFEEGLVMNNTYVSGMDPVGNMQTTPSPIDTMLQSFQQMCQSYTSECIALHWILDTDNWSYSESIRDQLQSQQACGLESVSTSLVQEVIKEEFTRVKLIFHTVTGRAIREMMHDAIFKRVHFLTNVDLEVTDFPSGHITRFREAVAYLGSLDTVFYQKYQRDKDSTYQVNKEYSATAQMLEFMFSTAPHNVAGWGFDSTDTSIFTDLYCLMMATLTAQEKSGILIHGPPGTGKTKSIERIKDKLLKTDGIACVTSQSKLAHTTAEKKSGARIVFYDELKQMYQEPGEAVNVLKTCMSTGEVNHQRCEARDPSGKGNYKATEQGTNMMSVNIETLWRQTPVFCANAYIHKLWLHPNQDFSSLFTRFRLACFLNYISERNRTNEHDAMKPETQEQKKLFNLVECLHTIVAAISDCNPYFKPHLSWVSGYIDTFIAKHNRHFGNGENGFEFDDRSRQHIELLVIHLTWMNAIWTVFVLNDPPPNTDLRYNHNLLMLLIPEIQVPNPCIVEWACNVAYRGMPQNQPIVHNIAAGLAQMCNMQPCDNDVIYEQHDTDNTLVMNMVDLTQKKRMSRDEALQLRRAYVKHNRRPFQMQNAIYNILRVDNKAFLCRDELHLLYLGFARVATYSKLYNSLSLAKVSIYESHTRRANINGSGSLQTSHFNLAPDTPHKVDYNTLIMSAPGKEEWKKEDFCQQLAGQLLADTFFKNWDINMIIGTLADYVYVLTNQICNISAIKPSLRINPDHSDSSIFLHRPNKYNQLPQRDGDGYAFRGSLQTCATNFTLQNRTAQSFLNQLTTPSGPKAARFLSLALSAPSKINDQNKLQVATFSEPLLALKAVKRTQETSTKKPNNSTSDAEGLQGSSQSTGEEASGSNTVLRHEWQVNVCALRRIVQMHWQASINSGMLPQLSLYNSNKCCVSPKDQVAGVSFPSALLFDILSTIAQCTRWRTPNTAKPHHCQDITLKQHALIPVISPVRGFSSYIAQPITPIDDTINDNRPHDRIDEWHNKRHTTQQVDYPEYIRAMRKVILEHANNGGGYKTFKWDNNLWITTAITFGVCEEHRCPTKNEPVENVIDGYIAQSSRNTNPIISYFKWVITERMMIGFNRSCSSTEQMNENMDRLVAQYNKQIDQTFYHKRAFDANVAFLTTQMEIPPRNTTHTDPSPDNPEMLTNIYSSEATLELDSYI